MMKTSKVIKGWNGAPHKAWVMWFESATEFCAEVERRNCWKYSETWAGETRQQTLERNVLGRWDLVKDAEQLLEKVYAEIDAPHAVWSHSVTGAYPVVPEALMGMPNPMRQRTSVHETRAPIKIVIDMVCSAGVHYTTLHKRGTAYLALAMALSNERPVELWASVPEGNPEETGIVLWPVSEAGSFLNLGRAAHLLSSMGLTRRAGYGLIHNEFGYWVDWAFGEYPYNTQQRLKYVTLMKEILGLEPGDMYVPPTHLNDPAVDDPVGFVRRSLAEHTARVEEG